MTFGWPNYLIALLDLLKAHMYHMDKAVNKKPHKSFNFFTTETFSQPDWFLYDRDLRHEGVKLRLNKLNVAAIAATFQI